MMVDSRTVRLASLRLLVLATTLVVGGLLADALLGVLGFPAGPPTASRTAPHPPDLTQTRVNREFTYRLSTNGRGYRYHDLPEGRSSDERRILALGDSFTEGVGVAAEETFSQRL